MTEVKTPPVKAEWFEDIDEVTSKAGAFEYYKSGERYPAGMIYCCPCGCGKVGSLAFRPAVPEHPSWNWDENKEFPTLEPSVHDPGHWHGYLRAGVWESC